MVILPGACIRSAGRVGRTHGRGRLVALRARAPALGRYGAAGLLVVAPGPSVLLQHRAPWSHGGDTWGVPGGARRRTESAIEAALRETVEETALDVAQVRITGHHVDDHGGWSYVTVLAETDAHLPVEPERESVAVRWVPLTDVEGMRLHVGFASAWPLLRPRLAC